MISFHSLAREIRLMSTHDDLPVNPARVIRNPDNAKLAELIGKMPNAKKTEFGNFNVATKVVARS